MIVKSTSTSEEAMRAVTLLLASLAFHGTALADRGEMAPDYVAPFGGIAGLFVRLDQHILDLQDRLAVQFEAIHDRLNALEENEIGRPEVK